MHLDIRGRNLETDSHLRQYVERRLAYALDRFAQRIRSVTVRFSNINGHRGGMDTQCLAEVALTSGDNLIARHIAENPAAAIDQASTKLKRAVAQHRARQRSRLRLRKTLAASAA